MITCNNLAIDYAGRYLFKNVQLNLLAKNRYAIVGANGSGKSTLLRLFAQQEKATQGTIEKSKSAVVGLLKQDHFRYEHERVIDVVIDGKPELLTAFHDKEELLTGEEFGEAECQRLADLEEIILNLDGYNAENRAERILQGLGINENFHHGPLSALSGGYKLRVLLAQALFQNPDILLLDEPTNHLDIVTIVWLEQFLLTEYQGLLIFVSHDQQFINTVSTHVLDVDYEKITTYPGTYDEFIAKKEAILEQKQHELAHKQQKIASMQEYADRFRAIPSKAKQALSRLKMIDRIELPSIKNSSRTSPDFIFMPERPVGKYVLRTDELAKSYSERTLFKKLSFVLQKGQKCAVIGPNGVGKSTFLKILMNQIKSDQGKFHWSETASIGYFAQDFHDLLKPEMTLLQWLCQEVRGATELAARKALGQMLFSGTDVDKPIKVLSGGECARLIFAKLSLEKHNVLVLDEPTNHLDLETIEGLIEGLKAFTGSVLFVTHNRYLINQAATHLLVMYPDQFEWYPGSYQEYHLRNATNPVN
jgi:ATPase subunit of ABC transporter with duplicated ATPase domains